MTKKFFLLVISFFVGFHSIAMERKPIAVSEDDTFDPCSDEDLLSLVVPSIEKRDLIYEENRGWRKKLFPQFLRREWGMDRVKVFPKGEGSSLYMTAFCEQGYAATLEPTVILEPTAIVEGGIGFCYIRLYEERFNAYLSMEHNYPRQLSVSFQQELAQGDKDACYVEKNGIWFGDKARRCFSLEEFDGRALSEEFFPELRQVKELLLEIYATVFADSMEQQPIAACEDDTFDPCSDEDLLDLVVPTIEKRDLIYEESRGWRKKLFPRFLREELGRDRVKVFPGEVEGWQLSLAFFRELSAQGFAARLEPTVVVYGSICSCNIKLYEERFDVFLTIEYNRPTRFSVSFQPELAQSAKDASYVAKEGFWFDDISFRRYIRLKEFDERTLKEEFFPELQQVKERLLRIYATVRDSLPVFF